MAAKIANVMARVESHIKEQAEETMDMLGIPVSCSVPSAPTARDELDDAAFYGLVHSRSQRGSVLFKGFEVGARRGVLRQSLDAACRLAIAQCACFGSAYVFFR